MISVWKIQNFSVTLILRQIKVSESRVSKPANPQKSTKQLLNSPKLISRKILTTEKTKISTPWIVILYPKGN